MRWGSALRDDRTFAKSLLAALIPGSVEDGTSLDNAIRVELLVTALGDGERPRTLADLLRVLESLSAGDVAEYLTDVVRARAEVQPRLFLRDVQSLNGSSWQ